MLSLIISFLHTNIIGGIEDNINLFVYPAVYENAVILKNLVVSGATPIHLFNDNQWILWTTYYFFASKMNPVFFYNLFLCATVLLNLGVAYWFFQKFVPKKSLAIPLSIIFNSSGYFMYHYRAHIDLSQVWITLIFLGLFLTKNFRYKYIALGLFLGIITGISNYLAYFLLLFISVYTLCRYLYTLVNTHREINNTGFLKEFFLLILSYFFFTFIILSGYLSTNFSVSATEINTSQNITFRSFEDFTIFTSRPWYYFLPSVDNPFFGNFSSQVINFLQNKWGYFLAQNYFKSEHAASFLGYVNLLLAFVGFVYFQKTQKNNNNVVLLYTLLVTAGVLIIFTLPPLFTISGVEIYSPSYLLYKIFPMFRVLARLGIYILLILLVFTGYGYIFVINTVYSLLHGRTRPFLVKLAQIFSILILLIISWAEFYVPIKITNLNGGLDIFGPLQKDTVGEASILVYPGEKEYLAFVTYPYHQQLLIPTARGCEYLRTTLKKTYVISFDNTFEKELCFNPQQKVTYNKPVNPAEISTNNWVKLSPLYKVVKVVSFNKYDIYVYN